MLLPDEAKGPDWNMQKRRRILEAITAREMEFIRLVCCREQPPYKKMAELMGVSEHTVEGYFKDLKRKLNVTCKTGLCLFAMAWGLVPCYRWGNDPDGPEGEGDPAGDGPAVAA